MTECDWCETKFDVTFDDESDELAYCPACGEVLGGTLDGELDMHEDEEWE